MKDGGRKIIKIKILHSYLVKRAKFLDLWNYFVFQWLIIANLPSHLGLRITVKLLIWHILYCISIYIYLTMEKKAGAEMTMRLVKPSLRQVEIEFSSLQVKLGFILKKHELSCYKDELSKKNSLCSSSLLNYSAPKGWFYKEKAKLYRSGILNT